MTLPGSNLKKIHVKTYKVQVFAFSEEAKEAVLKALEPKDEPDEDHWFSLKSLLESNVDLRITENIKNQSLLKFLQYEVEEE